MSHSSRGDFALNTRLLRITAMAAVIGALSTVAAYVLLDLIRFFTNLFFFQTLSLADRSPATNTLGAWVILVPVIGGLIVGVMARYGSDKIRGHGIPEAIEAILFGKSKMSPKVALLKPLSSGIVIGSGGPFGAEGPIIMTGGAIGSLLAQYFHLTAGERKALLVAGATAGMTAVFGTPVAAVLLAVELLLFELRPRSLLPVAVACAVAGFARPLLMGPGPLFPMQTAVPDPMVLFYCAAAGLACGVLALVLSTSLYKVEDLFGKLPLHWMWWPAMGGLVVGLGGYLEPRALGVGYDVIGDLLNNRLALAAVLALLGVKVVIWVVALGSGTSGGVLAPLLMMGAGLGVALGHLLPGSDPLLWPLVCMAATLGGVMRAPLTATVFAFGLTHDSNALLPLLATSAAAYGFTVLTMRRSILTEKIARRGYHIYREYGIDPLERHAVEEVMTREVQTIDADLSVREALSLHFGPGQAHRAFPVLRDGVLVGMADRAVLSACHSADPVASVADACEPPATVSLGENCRSVATRMARLRVERLPVVRHPQSGELVGIVSRSDLIKPSLAHFDEEEKRERMRGLPWQV
ncbi:chloride channel protein [Variovorax ginsengisoli]|uniref:Chloride channel protein n=1 Tax=Variovorax ginsengisoli TaxID=363844 RepID=A0ABT8SEA5_9BURK|nr:chloride channel protein [Variovorax ginsengisoli]MDN8617533.1 chloride channel protein [Variovorax ginsengisoli]MDO1536703.1 chloride channel protein [Variovorax ginsengisoli]